jgi:hypothetical protein
MSKIEVGLQTPMMICELHMTNIKTENTNI